MSTDGRARLIAAVGATAAALLVGGYKTYEGTRNTPYPDTGGIWTVCTGSTRDVDPKHVYTPEECAERLDDDAATHAEGVAACVPTKDLTTGQLVAFNDFAFNVGVPKFCGSTMAKLIRSGDVPAACAQIRAWRFAPIDCHHPRNNELPACVAAAPDRWVRIDCFLDEHKRQCGGIKARRLYELKMCGATYP